MTASLLLLAWLAPLLAILPAARAAGHWWPVAAVLPALAAAVLVPAGGSVELPWLLLGTRLGLDPTARYFLLGGALLWLGAALYARDAHRADPHAGRFRVFFLLAMAGNVQLILAQEAVGFYLGFALMGLATYGLVVHRRACGARRAARTYLAWTLLGEVLLFSALVLLAADSPDLSFSRLQAAPPSDAAVLLLILGLGIKLALPGLHLWQPLAYPAAPAAAAAVMSGAMINAGLLGWMRFLPIGQPGYGLWGEALVTIGLGAAFYGVVVGLLQRRAKVVLAYSSMSQLGVVTGILGLALAYPGQATLLSLAATVYALHHGLVKGALFLAVDAHRRATTWSFAVLVVLALALAGAPLTSGGSAKALLKSALPEDTGWLEAALVISTLATTVLMARFLVLVRRSGRSARRIGRQGTAALLSLTLLGPVLALTTISAASLWAAVAGAWPLLVGAGIALGVWRRAPPWLRALPGALPPGDLPAMIGRGLARTGRGLRPSAPSPPFALPRPRWPLRGVDGWESALRQWPVAGAAWMLLGLAILALIVF